MPAKPAWLLQVPEIVAELRALDVPVLDRAAIQRLFKFQRRRAILFMHEQGGYQAREFFLGGPCWTWQITLAPWQPGIRLEPGFLNVTFRDPQELLQRLFALTQAMANDFEGFERQAAGSTARARAIDTVAALPGLPGR
jgi:hypothetical protein